MDLSYFDKQPAEINSTEQREFELEQLSKIAKLVGDYEWKYTGQVAEKNGEETHSGPTAQEIAKIPGYENCVKPDENGVLTVDITYLALAMMGSLAALTRIVLEDKYADFK